MKKYITALVFLILTGMSVNAKEDYTLEVNPEASYTGNVQSNISGVDTSYKSKKQTPGAAFEESFTEGILLGTNKRRSFPTGGAAGTDPYILNIDGIKYIMVKDNKDGKYDKNDLLGIDDTPSTVFASLKPLDKNGDGKLTGTELTLGGIRLVAVKADGKLAFGEANKDFTNSKVVFIYITELRKTYKNNGTTGAFGLYDAVIKDSGGKQKIITGEVTFESEKELKKYF